MYNLVILGAGAAGLVAAWEAARRGARVAVVDHAAVVGRKVRVSGGGKANVTNRNMGPEWFVGEQSDFCTHILRRYNTGRILDMLERLHMTLEEREDGQLFCQTSAAQLVSSLHDVCVRHGVDFLLRHSIESLTDGPAGSFRIQLQGPQAVRCLEAEAVLNALGGPAWPQIGATDLGMRLARQWGHRIVPVRPVLSPFIMPADWPLQGLAGISARVRLRVGEEGRTFTQALLFTHKGVSGPVVLHASCMWQREVPLYLDFLPDLDLRELLHEPAHGKMHVRSLLGRHLPDRLVDALLGTPELALLVRRKIAELGKAARTSLHQAVHAHMVTPQRLEGLAKAEASAGGVATRDVDPKSLMSYLRPNLYFAGEVLDVTGLLGGYNLHWAWASGMQVGASFEGASVAEHI